MSAQRELILSRVDTLLRTPGLFTTVVRNDFIQDESLGSIAMLFDGDEEPVPNTGEGRSRPRPGWAQPTLLLPEVYVLSDYNMRPVDIGPWLSWAIAKLNYLLTHDSELLGLLYNADPILYLGAETGLMTGRSLAGELSLKYQFRFVNEFTDPGAAPVPTPEDSTEPT